MKLTKRVNALERRQQRAAYSEWGLVIDGQLDGLITPVEIATGLVRIVAMMADGSIPLWEGREFASQLSVRIEELGGEASAVGDAVRR